MNQEQVQQIIDMVQGGLNKLAETMGVAVPELWEILIRQQYVEAIEALVILTIAIVFAVGSYKNLYDYTERSYGIDREINPVFAILLGVASFFIAIILLASPAIGQLINPEYYAIKDIAEFIRGGSL